MPHQRPSQPTHPLLLAALIGAALLLGGCGREDGQDDKYIPFSELEPAEPLSPVVAQLPTADQLTSRPPTPEGPPVELQWPELVPEGYNPEQMLIDAGIMEMDDFDPRAQDILDKLRMDWDMAPLVESLHGKRVKLPGYVVPLEGDRDQVSEFLLVPYYGACIHVPPPPANQTVYVLSDTPAHIPEMFAVVWVTGVMATERLGSDLGAAGYVIFAEKVEPFEL